MIRLAFAIALALIALPQLSYAKPIVSLGCDAVDTAGVVFTDPAARAQIVMTPSGNVNMVCNGHLLPAAVLPTAPVEFTNKSGLDFVCLTR
jgi:hypothetical protein